MTTKNNRLAAFVFGLAVPATASPSLAQRYVDNNNGYPVSAARAEALRECNARAQPYSQCDWGVGQTAICAPAWLSTTNRNDHASPTRAARCARAFAMDNNGAPQWKR
jgi:hypothetical protein